MRLGRVGNPNPQSEGKRVVMPGKALGGLVGSGCTPWLVFRRLVKHSMRLSNVFGGQPALG